MPRRRKVRCPSKSASAEKLTVLIEWALTEWLGWPVDEWALDWAATEDAWQVHRETILQAFIAQVPGCRPFGAYAAGEIPLPDMVRKPYESDLPYQARDGLIHSYNCYWQTQQDEFLYLEKLGVLPAEEITAAKKRFATSDDWQGYKSIFRDEVFN